jgi:DNA-binding NarL/FixJ family response regulator
MSDERMSDERMSDARMSDARMRGEPTEREREENNGVNATVSVLIVDDHSIFRSGLRADLGADLNVLAEAGDVDDAVQAITEHQPNVVLLDVHLPGGSGGGGAEVVRRSAPLCPSTRFLALSVSDSAEDVVGVIRAGARGYITKSSSGAEVSRAIRAVADGDAVFSPRLAGFVLDAFGAASGEQSETPDELDRLSTREREVMRLIARGYAYKEVASELYISVKTVETHVSAVLRKLQLSSRHELTAWALARKLL